MEVFSIIASKEDIKDLFKKFIYNYSDLKLNYEDSDTAYFINPITEKNEIYFHNEFDNEDDYDVNFSDSEKEIIEKYFDNKTFYIFDLQFKSEVFLNKILQDFRTFIEKQDFLLAEEIKILCSHPKKGLFKW